jgi:uncharacterized protein YegP (UPF0339 family)
MVHARFIIYKDDEDRFRWRLRAASTDVVAESTESFDSKEACERRIAEIREQVTTAEVVDMSRRGNIIR